MDIVALLEKEEDSDTLSYLVCPAKPVYDAIKRTMDLVCAVCAGVVLLIPMVAIGLMIRLESKGPAIFKQHRLGRNGVVFTIYKFRTMKCSAPSDLPSRELSVDSDYMTKLGRFFRKTSIDELPQLWNVIRGDMSIVGYRPLCVTEVKANEMRRQTGVFQIRPGITGWAQVNGRNDISDEEKIRLDLQYLQERSLKMDMLCLLKTVMTVISGKGNI